MRNKMIQRCLRDYLGKNEKRRREKTKISEANLELNVPFTLRQEQHVFHAALYLLATKCCPCHGLLILKIWLSLSSLSFVICLNLSWSWPSLVIYGFFNVLPRDFSLDS